MIKIKYELSDNGEECRTSCPFIDGFMVGAINCVGYYAEKGSCPYFISDNLLTNEVTCSHK